MSPDKVSRPVRDAFMKVERALRFLTDDEKRRVIKAVALLLDYDAKKEAD